MSILSTCPFRCVAFAIGVVLLSSHPMSLYSEESLFNYVEFIISQHLDTVVNLHFSLLFPKGVQLSSDARKMISVFKTTKRSCFPLRIYLDKIENSSLLNQIRFAYSIFYKKNTKLKLLFGTHEAYNNIASLVMNGFEEKNDNLFLLGKISWGSKFSSDIDIENNNDIVVKTEESKKRCRENSEAAPAQKKNRLHKLPVWLFQNKHDRAKSSSTYTALQMINYFNKKYKN